MQSLHVQVLGIADHELRSRILQAATAGAPGATELQLLPAAAQDPDTQWPSDCWLHSQDCGEEQQWECPEAGVLASQQQQWQQDGPRWQQESQQQEVDDNDDDGWGHQHEEQQQQQDEAWKQEQEQQQQAQQWHSGLQQHDSVQWQGRASSDIQPMCLHAQAAQHAGPRQRQVVPLQQQPQHGLAWPPPGQQQAWQRQWSRQQQQQQQHCRDALQPLPVNQQQQAQAAAVADSSSSGGQALLGAIQLQSSIAGFVTRQPRQQQQQGDAKEQWRELFKQPKQPLGAHNPAEQGPGQVLQARIGTHGQVVRPLQPPTPAAAAAMAPRPALPQAPGPSLPRSVRWLSRHRMSCVCWECHCGRACMSQGV